MVDRKKVIKGIECCSRVCWLCPTVACPYYGHENCSLQLKRDALELLKEQEVRVLQLDEALKDENSLEISPYVFVEEKDRNDIFIGYVTDKIYGDYHSDDIKITVYRIWLTDKRVYSKSDYMRKIRFWSHLPTEEQRKDVKWDE